MPPPLKVAALQRGSTPDVDRHLASAGRRRAPAAAAGVRRVALPAYGCLPDRSDRNKPAFTPTTGAAHGGVLPAQRRL